MDTPPPRSAALKLGKPSPIRLNMMVVGETGSGKTTFLKTLFKMYCGNKIIRAELASKTVKTVKIEEIGLFTLATDHLDCEVHLFDSPGYGDFINNLDAIETVKYHLEQAHKAWLETRGNEMTEKARNAVDARIHCVFYFIAPHRIKFIDKAFLKQLAGLAPLVMVIAKADTMTWHERKDHLIAVLELVDELQNECKMPIAFDFHEEDTGFMEHTMREPRPVCSRVDSPAQSDLEFSYQNFLDLSPCLEQEFAGDLPNTTYEHRFRYHGMPYQPDANALQVHFPRDNDTAPPQVTCSESPDSFEPSFEPTYHMDIQEASPVFPDPPPLQHAKENVSPLAASAHQPLPKIRNAFAVVCDTSDSGKREFPWGSVDIYNEAHSDFRRLQRLIFESDHIVRLRELTQEMSMALNKPKSLTDHTKVLKKIKPVLESASRKVSSLAHGLNAFFLVVGWAVLPALLMLCLYGENSSGVHRALLRPFNAGAEFWSGRGSVLDAALPVPPVQFVPIEESDAGEAVAPKRNVDMLVMPVIEKRSGEGFVEIPVVSVDESEVEVQPPIPTENEDIDVVTV